jgi:hypothetical protein
MLHTLGKNKTKNKIKSVFLFEAHYSALLHLLQITLCRWKLYRNEPRTVVTLALVIRSNRSARSQDLIHTRLILGKTACMSASRTLFQQTVLQKKRESNNLCLEFGLGSPKEGLRPACAKLWRIFSSRKNLSASRKQGSRRDILQRIEGIRGIFVLSGLEL